VTPSPYRFGVRSHLNPTQAAVYEAARRFVEVGLQADGSLFVPDRSVWSASTLEDLYNRFNLAPDESGDSFEEKFARQLEGATPLIHAGTLDRAVAEAWSKAKPGDTILLAPACASFDQFQGYEHRGRHFKELVRSLQKQ